VSDMEGVNFASSLADSDNESPNDFLFKLKEHRKNNPKNLVIGSLNINSVRNKFDVVRHMLNCRYVDILALCETKLDNSFPNGQFSISNYNCFRKDRNSNGGGLMYHIRSDIPHRRQEDLEQLIDKLSGFESLIIEVMMGEKEKWIYVLGYKPPNITKSVFENAFSFMCDVVINETSNLIVLGDYNHNLLEENSFYI